MKKMLLVFALGLMVNLAFAQNSNSCVSCNNNVIDTTKFSSAVGSENISTGLGSFASGYQNQALGETANAFGINNLAAGKASFACGLNSEAIEKYSFAFGDSAIAWSRNSIALGKHVSVFGPYSFGVGENVKTTITSSMVIGSGYDDYNPLVNDVGKSLMIGFNSYKPTLFVGGAVGNGFTGKVGIGEVTDPQAKLHIRADTLEIASVLIEPGLSSNSAYLYLGNNNYGLKYSPTRLEFLTGGKYVFYDGNVGIGTYQPAARLHVDGDFQVGDSLNPKPIRLYGSINADGENAVSFGRDNMATGVNSFASGYMNQAVGNYSFASGYQCKAIGNFSFAASFFSKAIGERSFALGYYSTAEGDGSVALGMYSHTNTNALLSIAIGSRVSTQNNYSIVMGYASEDTLKNPVEKSLMIGFNSNLPTFFVGPSSGSGKTGSIGIGNITDPQVKLHILSDEGEAAELKLEYRTTGNNQMARIYLGTHRIEAGNSHMSFYTTNSSSHFVFQNGSIRSIEGSEALPAYSFIGSPNTGIFRPEQNKMAFSTGGLERMRITSAGVGIGTDDPQTKLQVKDGDIFIEDIDRGIIMKSPDGNCWRGTLDNTGSLHFVQVNCDDLQTGQPESQPEKPPKTNIYPNPAGDRVNVSIDQTLVGSVLEISDLNGKIILTQKLANSESFIDLSDYHAGMYIFNISDESGKRLESKKVTKQ